ncbi:uncharacterized protein DFL_000439 [Arthrobotrys flagrans]|uniref:Zn(2)-C6 fungal-type domain-containing protein n=1 Tax=Arthrobotrys flagrans TaxID=97331 RepID=A0A437AEA1_ARTFL|nr:hypothetical protein DFL_000439 [Arthrobotrys flagrans]
MPPKSNTMCWRCRHDRQACVRDFSSADPATCDRCKRYKYTCTLAEPTPEERQGRVLEFWKCSYCRDARQKCRESQDDLDRCDRCVLRNLPCSVRTSKKHMPRKKGSSGGGSSGGLQGGDFTEGDSNSPEYDPLDEDEASYHERYSYEASSSVNQHYGEYGQDYSQYTHSQYPSYGEGTYHQSSYGQPASHAYGQPQYGYGGY